MNTIDLEKEFIDWYLDPEQPWVKENPYASHGEKEIVDWFKTHLLRKASATLSDWSLLEKVGTPEKWIKMYEYYQELLTKADTASWWQEQYEIANKERNELKAATLSDEDIERMAFEKYPVDETMQVKGNHFRREAFIAGFKAAQHLK